MRYNEFMSFEYTAQVKEPFSQEQRVAIGALLEKNPLFCRTYDFDGKKWYEFRDTDNQDTSKLPNFSIVIKHDGLYISTNSPGPMWEGLEDVHQYLSDSITHIVDYQED